MYIGSEESKKRREYRAYVVKSREKQAEVGSSKVNLLKTVFENCFETRYFLFHYISHPLTTFVYFVYFVPPTRNKITNYTPIQQVAIRSFEPVSRGIILVLLGVALQIVTPKNNAWNCKVSERQGKQKETNSLLLIICYLSKLVENVPKYFWLHSKTLKI